MRESRSTVFVLVWFFLTLTIGCGGLFGTSHTGDPAQPVTTKTGGSPLTPGNTLYVVQPGNNFGLPGVPSYVLEYPRSSTGNPGPSAEITGPAGLDFTQIAVNPVGTLFVGAIGAGYPQILVYPVGASGTATPNSWVAPELAAFCLDSTGKLYLTDPNIIQVYDSDKLSSGPLRTIRTAFSSNTGPNSFSHPNAIAADPAGNTYVLNESVLNDVDAVLMFSASADGTVTPNTVIAGPTTRLNRGRSIALDAQGNIYVGAGEPASSSGMILVFAAAATGDTPPIRTISGPNTSLGRIIDLHVAADGTLYVSAESTTDSKTHIMTFAATADGDARPLTDLSPAAPVVKSVSVEFERFAIL